MTVYLFVQAFVASRLVVAGSLGGLGLVIAYVFVAGQVFVNGRVHDGLRASVQSLLTFINGMGLLVGNLLFGALRRWAGGELRPAFAFGAVLMSLLVIVFVIGFKERSAVSDQQTQKAEC
jgi:MFS family permease